MAAPYRCDRVAGDSWRKDSAAALVLDLHMHMHACAPIQVDQRVLQVDDSLMQCIIRVRTSCRAASEAAERSSASPAGYPLPRGQPGWGITFQHVDAAGALDTTPLPDVYAT